MTFKNILTGAGFAALLGSASMGLSSCKKDFIDLNDPTRIPTTEGYTDSLSILNGVTAAYAGLQDIYGKSGSNNGLYVFSEIPSDNATTVISGQLLNEFDFFGITTSNPRLQSQWVVTYRTIARANVVLARAGGVKLTAATRARYAAEVKFIRALSYFNAVRIWGAIPLVTSEIATIPDAYTYGRTPVTQVYAQIEKDLTDAIADLPATVPAAELGRVTKSAAQGLLGKVYLTETKYSDAATILNTVITSNAYALQATYANIFSITNEMNSEILFAVRYSKGALGVGSPFANNFATASSLVGGIGTSDQFFTLHKGLVDAFTASGATDVRGAASYGTGTVGSTTVYYTKKYTDTPTASLDAENDWIVLRYADVLLMYAEAVNETSGPSAAALEAVNKVIRRSRNLPVGTLAPTVDLPATTTAAVLRDRIELERRLELNMEGHRWFDLVRTGRAIPVMTAYIAQYTIRPNNATTGNLVMIDTHNLVFPLPIQEIQTNSILTQNPGYN
ncbi:RagB/SusD family nutrient uptake outer membrane protein [Hymenobacter negativus]|uniref:RagB/SusD family nutrient uptake outer membrane protein n=1 Tax=Hymenobacter negativus TaxID=2795026 RepID=A0ABS3QLW7_9BACT|nr:RagB/SusD family nutrient uptake outer membrane protein [Hymenobacter negativus]MBO2012270.1 RagB/SusD family nutrient uptake outer membrane protein [Hymenobacter negativus]